ncbi:retropepsin-like domain-containing protein [Marivirga sp. S37H4]|uniref:Retropepsin-like domain-containing protein n=1 Tax=Marivirga aurantiaca TaxID=2802615 RepID=A0A935CAI9_9BACT|nr:aspartyl protease family protein [Marivirga aurantiaca]MBK6266620.1 retropepsin-like domain-containing protein [Marivirga aurantiaca]
MRTLKITLWMMLMSMFTYAQDYISTETEFDKRPIVKMNLNGENVWVLLDTGSEYTILNMDSQDKYQYKTYPLSQARYQVQGVGKQLMQMYTVRKAVITFNEIQLKGIILAYDLSNVANSIKQRTGKTIAGIVGLEMMRAHGFVIDVANNKVITKSGNHKKKVLQNEKSTLAVTAN